MTAELDRARERIYHAAREGLERSLHDLLGRAIERAPEGVGGAGIEPSEDPGRLRASGHVTPIEIESGRLSGKVAFDTPYAAAQHEGHAIMHRGGTEYEWRARKWSVPGTGPKYLENPLKEMAPRYVRAIAENVARTIRAGA